MRRSVIQFLPALLLMVFALIPVNRMMAQCQGGSAYNTIPINITTTWTAYNDIWGGEYLRFNATAGVVYEFSLCSTDGGANTFDTEISLNSDAGVYLGVYNDNATGCGTASKFSWACPTTGVYRILVSQPSCTSNSTNGTHIAVREVPCSTPAVGGTATTSRTAIVSNDSIVFRLTGHTGTIDWEYYFNTLPWNSSGSSAATVNFFVTAQSASTMYARARLVNGGCVAYSNTIQATVACAVPFNETCNLTLDYISNVTVNTLNNNSTYNNNTAYQYFPNATTTLCKGSVYNISISSVGLAQGRSAWIDYNNNGSFDDAGENILAPTAPSALASSGNFTVPMGAVTGSVKMRVVSVAGITPNALTCAATYYPNNTNTTDGGEWEEYTITLADAPTSVAGSNQTICSSTATMAANNPTAGTGAWSVVTGSGTFGSTNQYNTTVTGIAQGTNVYRWTVSTTACGTATSSVTILNNSPSTALAGSNATTCVPSIPNMSATAPVIGTGAWSVVSGSGTFTNPTIATTAVTGVGAGVNVYMWTTTNGSCTSTSTVTITYGPPSAAVAGSNQTICSPNAILAGNSPSIGTGNWSVVTGGGLFTDATNPGTSVSNIGPGSNTFRWTVSNNCGSNTSDVTIQNDGPSPAVAGASQTICYNDSTQMLANTPSVGTGTWSLISGNGNIVNPSSPTTDITNMTVGPNVFRWTTTNLSCTSTSDVTILVDSSSVNANAGLDIFTCNTSTALGAVNPSPGTGTWGVVVGTGSFSNANSPSATVSGLSSGLNQFTWSVTNGGCTDVDTLNVNIETPPSGVSAGMDQNICPQNALLSASSPGTGTGTWSVVSGSGSFVNPSDPNTTVNGLALGANTLLWTVTNSCGTGTDEVIISVGQYGVPYYAGPDQSVCVDTAVLNAVPAPTGATSIWSVSSGAATFSSQTSANPQVTALGPGQNKLVWTVFYGVCVLSDTVNIDYLQPATLADAGVDFQVCTPGFNLAGNVPTVGNGSWLLVSGTGNIVNPTSPTATVQNVGNGPNVFRWYITNGTCYSSYDEVTVTRTLPPTPAVAGADYTTCNVVEVMAGNTPIIGTGQWNVVYGPVSLVNPHQPFAQVTGIVLGDSVVLTWSITNGGCTSIDTITINTTLPATAAFTPTISGVNVQFANQSTQAFAYNWNFGDGTTSTQANPSHTYLAYGTYNVRLIAYNTCKNDTTFQVVTIGSVSAEDDLKATRLDLYPNPASEVIYFTLGSTESVGLSAEVTDATGRIMPLNVVETGSGNYSVQTAQLPAGYYILRVSAGGKTYHGRFIRQ
ncbi:MAG: GEVED domain-containing protein [Bacteroidia bacterium]|nr:GEVED domain-containing protein [Bacteroidia bacterium]